MARMFGAFTHPMFFTTEERFVLTVAGDRIEHPFEFLFSPDHVPEGTRQGDILVSQRTGIQLSTNSIEPIDVFPIGLKRK